MNIKENLDLIKKELPAQVTLVAVSKVQSTAAIMEAYEAGHRDFGENYVQELLEKQAVLPHDIRWHYIGHLQSNKVKYIAPFVHLVHGVDSLKLLQEINKQAQKQNRVIDCLLQIFIAREETKFGLSFDECEALMASEKFTECRNVRVIGFMAMASNTENEQEVRKEFTGLKNFYDRVNKGNLSVLSFGMSGDYRIAVECGSTMVRIGSAIFGERHYQ